MILSHYAMIESVATYTHATVFIGIEANGDWLRADRYKKTLENRGGHLKFIFINCDTSGKNRTGYNTTNQIKELAVEELREDLSNGHIRLAQEFVSRDPPAMLKKIRNQLKVFRKYIKQSINGATKSSKQCLSQWLYDGKASGPDDVALHLAIGRFLALITQSSDQYQELALANGWPS